MAAAQHVDDVRKALTRALEWRGLASSPRLSRFLRTVVEWTLEGRAQELKESAIGVEVFDRDPTYDPRTDPIVRVQAVRLRSKLVEYYASAGAHADLIIELPPGGYVPSFRARTSAPSPPLRAATSSIAVLPFVDMSPEQNMQYFCDGIAEEILHLLARNPRLQVAARTSSFVFKSKAEDVRKIGDTLGVESVLEGSVRLWGTRTRITAQLTSARDGFHIWSETFDRELTDIFKLQDEIAAAISRRLDPQAGDAPSAPETSVEVYRLTLLARHHCNRQTPPDFFKAKEYFEQAVTADPSYAPAWSGLALTLVYLAFFGGAPPVDLAEPAMAAARRNCSVRSSHSTTVPLGRPWPSWMGLATMRKLRPPNEKCDSTLLLCSPGRRRCWAGLRWNRSTLVPSSLPTSKSGRSLRMSSCASRSMAR